jgi:hypothetical protein
LNAQHDQLLLVTATLLRTLSMRLLSIIALLMTFALFVWALARATPLAFLTAGAFGIGVLWPVLLVAWLSRNSDGKE